MVLRIGFAVGVSVFLGIQTAAAVPVGFSAIDNGRYTQFGTNDPNSPLIITGFVETTGFRNFVVFDLTSAASREAATAELQFLPNNGRYLVAAGDESKIFGTFEFTGSITDLVDGNGGVPAYDDLGSGTPYGSVSIPTPGTVGAMPAVSVPLDQAALTAINTLLDGPGPYTFAIGGECLTCTANQQLWAGSSLGVAAKLELTSVDGTPIPLPGALALLAPVVAAAGIVQLRRRRAAANG